MALSSKKLFYKIGEICRMCDIPPHVLRYWETEFAVLSPTKNKGGQRIYREKDLALVRTIKQLLYEEGYTISGANRKLLEDGKGALPLFEQAGKADASRNVARIRADLEAILELLED